MAQGLAMEWIIRPAIFEFVFEATADFNAIFRGNGDIAAVEEAVEIAAKEDAVVYGVRPALVKRLDVGGFERREGMLLCYRTCTEVGIRYKDAESPLAQARRDRGLFPITGSIFLDKLGFPTQVKKLLMPPYALEIPPNELACLFVQLIAFSLAPDD
jgi:hypothetical protein